jgi:outer membrane protein assembly factor BamB
MSEDNISSIADSHIPRRNFLTNTVSGLGGALIVAGCVTDSTDRKNTGEAGSTGTSQNTGLSISKTTTAVDLDKSIIGPASTGVHLWNCDIHSGLLHVATRGGKPPIAADFDLQSESVVSNYRLDQGDSTEYAVLAMEATDEYVHYVTSSDGGIYRVNKDSGSVERLATVGSGGNFFFTLDTAPDGTIYTGGTNNSTVFEVDPESGTTHQIGPLADTTFAYQVEAFGDRVYVGVGNTTGSGLYEIDRETREFQRILPDIIGGFPSKIDTNGRYLVCYNGGNSVATVDMESRSGEKSPTASTVENVSQRFAVSDESENAFYYPLFASELGDTNIDTTDSVHLDQQSALYRFDIEDGERTMVTEIPDLAAGNGLNYRSTKVENGIFVGVQKPSAGKIVTVSLDSGATSIYDMMDRGMESTKVNPMSIGKFEGKPVTGQNGAMIVHSPRTGERERIEIEGEIKEMATTGKTLFLGQYPDAKLLKYDGSAVTEVGTAESEARPLDLAYHSQSESVLMGTEPGYGAATGGALVRYGIGNNEFTAHKNAIPDQSVNKIAPLGDRAILAGDIELGGGTKPVTEEAKVVKFDIQSEDQEWSVTPVPGAGKITGLVANDSVALGMASNTAFLIDVASGDVVSRKDVGYNRSFDRGPGGEFYGMEVEGITRTTLPKADIRHFEDAEVRGTNEFTIIDNDMYYLNPETWDLIKIDDIDSY